MKQSPARLLGRIVEASSTLRQFEVRQLCPDDRPIEVPETTFPLVVWVDANSLGTRGVCKHPKYLVPSDEANAARESVGFKPDDYERLVCTAMGRFIE
jgi:hypothetical protein